MKFFVSELYPHARFTAGVLRDDIEKILERNGYFKISFPIEKANFWNKLQQYITALKIYRTIPHRATVFFHFPIRSRAKRVLLQLLKLKKCRPVAYLHDFEGLRTQDNRLLRNEFNQLKPFDLLLAQNELMEKWLEPMGKMVINIEMYDYLDSALASNKSKRKEANVAFVGNPTKAPFINQLHQITDVHFQLYGHVPNSVRAFNCHLHGSVDPRMLPSLLEGSFGLVWDGNDIDTCSGGFGQYLRINTSHKLAAYILAGLPILIWDQSAMSNWVKKKGIGICISSLKNLSDVIEKLSTDDYDSMQFNIKRLQPKIAAGAFLEDALKKISERFNC